jgi:hypothetical protein
MNPFGNTSKSLVKRVYDKDRIISNVGKEIEEIKEEFYEI